MFLPEFSPLSIVVLVSMLQLCFWVFVSRSVLSLYFFYEASLFPILFIILKWGAYPDRALRAFMLLAYTVVFTMPFIFVLFSIYSAEASLCLPLLAIGDSSYSLTVGAVAFLTFAVKLPVYGLHF